MARASGGALRSGFASTTKGGRAARRVVFTANGTRHELALEPRELLVYVLRDRLALTGTNVGCDTSSCGACTVLVNGESVKSCTMFGPSRGRRRHHHRGLAQDGVIRLQTLRRTTACNAGSAAGMVMAAVSLLLDPDPTEREVRVGLEISVVAPPSCRSGGARGGRTMTSVFGTSLRRETAAAHREARRRRSRGAGRAVALRSCGARTHARIPFRGRRRTRTLPGVVACSAARSCGPIGRCRRPARGRSPPT
jgi:carbon-monoxide dehydrogenase small subunit